MAGESGVTQDTRLLSCLAGSSELCCEGIREYFGESALFSGCQCYENVFEAGFEALPFAGHTLRPLVEGRLETCGVATISNGGCEGLMAGTGAVISTVSEQTDLPVPVLNQTDTMLLYSGAFSSTLQGHNDWGYYKQCLTLPTSRYCTVIIEPPKSKIPTKWGVCVPEASTEADISAAVTATYPEHFERYEPEVNCNTLANHGWTAGAIAMACVWGILVALALVSSVMGRVERRREQRRRRGLEAEEPPSPLAGRPGRAAAVGKDCIMCFDLHRNWRVLSRRGPPKAGVDLSVLNGLRVLSMVFIIIGHTTSYGEWFNSVAYPSVALAPYLVNQSFFNNWWLGIFFVGWYSVDTFLFVGGVVCGSRASLQIEALKRRQEKISSRLDKVLLHVKFWTLYIFGRYLRLLPVLLMVLFTAWQLVPSLGESPWWERHWDVVYGGQCGQYWWSTVLMVQNFWPAPRDPEAIDTSTPICLGPSWYLAVDMQLHIFVAPLLLCIWHFTPNLRRSFVRKSAHFWGTASILLLIVTSVAVTGYIVVRHQCWLQGFAVGDYYHYYIKPWTRSPPFLFGLLLGLIFHNLYRQKPGSVNPPSLGKSLGVSWDSLRIPTLFYSNDSVVAPGASPRNGAEAMKYRMPKFACITMTIAAIGTMLTLMFLPNTYFATQEPWPRLSLGIMDMSWSQAEAYAYQSLRYFFWGASLFAIVFVFLSGHGGWLRKFLAGDFWAPLAKLTYGAYLIQAPLMEAVLWGTSTQPVFFTVPQTLARAIMYWTGSYFFALIVFLLVEAPFGHLQALLFGVRPKKDDSGAVSCCPKSRKRVSPSDGGAGEPAGTPRAASNEGKGNPRGVQETRPSGAPPSFPLALPGQEARQRFGSAAPDAEQAFAATSLPVRSPRLVGSPRDAAAGFVEEPLSPPTSPYRDMVGIVKKHTPANPVA